MNVVDGREIRAPLLREADVIVVGSGPAGAAVARTLSAGGMSVIVVEEGPWVRAAEFPEDAFSAMSRLYRDMSASILTGSAPMPFVQGKVVGGSSVINGAISWRMPKDIWSEWILTDPALAEALPWETLESISAAVEADLHIAATETAIAGPNNLLLGAGAEALGLEHRPIARNVRGCRGLGRCLQGCPEGNKLSMDRSYLPDACRDGAVIFSSTTVDEIVVDRGRVTGVGANAAGGGRISMRARRAVVLAASAVQTPALLLRNRLSQGPVGRHFQCHPGVSIAGRMPTPVRMWTGATQGHEVIGLRKEGIKFEALGYDMAIVASRLKGVGAALARDIADLGSWVNWGAAIRARGEGRVRAGRRRARVSLRLERDDVQKIRRGVRVMGEMLLASGAEYVTPGVHGWHAKVTDRAVMARFEDEGPLNPTAYTMAVTHMFGTCRMGSDPRRSVVRPDFRHHAIDRLYVADSSVFPTSLGVNPQTSILVLATHCARGLLQDRPH